MAVFRVNKTKNYTVMSNYHLKDARLSFKAKGLLSFMLSVPETWKFSVEGLAACSGDGIDSVASGLKELEACGYLKRSRVRDASGKLGAAVYDFYEVPEDETADENEEPAGEAPILENPIQGNDGQLNINYIKYLNNKKAVAETRAREDERTQEDFADLLKLYCENVRHTVFASPLEAERLGLLLDDFGRLWLEKAIEETALNRGTTIRYVETILERWRKSGKDKPWIRDAQKEKVETPEEREARLKREEEISKARDAEILEKARAEIRQNSPFWKWRRGEA